MSNQMFNEVMEANLTDPKPNQETDSEQRVQFIRNKYIQRKYIDRSDTDDSVDLLYEAVDVRDFRALLQAYAEGVDMSQPFSNRVCLQVYFLHLNDSMILCTHFKIYGINSFNPFLSGTRFY